LVLPPIEEEVPDSPVIEPQSEHRLGNEQVNAPDEARVMLDDVERGQGTLRLTNVQPGARAIEAWLSRADGCDAATVSRTVTVVAGRTDTVTLEPRRCGVLVLRITPPSARYTSQLRDRTIESGIVVQIPLLQLSPGTYRLRLQADGCLDHD